MTFPLSEYQFNGGNEYTAPNGKIYTLSSPAPGRVEAKTAGGRTAGRMNHGGPYSSEPEQQTIGNIAVSGPHRGKGVATAMLDYARQEFPNLHHSRVLTDDGRGFAAASPRSWQPKLPLTPDTEHSNGPNGGEAGPSPWSSYVDFGPNNARLRMESSARSKAQFGSADPQPSHLGEQQKLFQE